MDPEWIEEQVLKQKSLPENHHDAISVRSYVHNSIDFLLKGLSLGQDIELSNILHNNVDIYVTKGDSRGSYANAQRIKIDTSHETEETIQATVAEEVCHYVDLVFNGSPQNLPIDKPGLELTAKLFTNIYTSENFGFIYQFSHDEAKSQRIRDELIQSKKDITDTLSSWIAQLSMYRLPTELNEHEEQKAGKFAEIKNLEFSSIGNTTQDFNTISVILSAIVEYEMMVVKDENYIAPVQHVKGYWEKLRSFISSEEHKSQALADSLTLNIEKIHEVHRLNQWDILNQQLATPYDKRVDHARNILSLI